MAALLLTTGCSGSASKTEEQTPAKKDTAGASAMADMPGMGKTPDTVTLTAAQIEHGKVSWEPVTMGSASQAASVPGELTTDEDRTVRLGAPAQGRVLSVNVNPGDRVHRGDPLVVLQSTDAGAAQSDVAKAAASLSSRRAQAAYARAARDRAERLLALKAIPRQDYDRAIADDQLAQSEVQQSEAELRRARTLASQLGADTSSNGSIVLRSPQDGVILSRSAVPGAVVAPGTPLIVVTDASRLWLVVNAPEQFAGLFRTGAPLRFAVPAYPDSFSARITALGAGLDPETRTLQVRGSVDARGGLLKPGMLATVAVSGGRSTPAASLPDDAVQLIQGKPNVFIAAPDGKGGVRFTRREVEVGSRRDGRVTVLRGVAAGDVVVTAGAFAVKAQFQKAAMPKMEM